jgi:hypothetical protein
MDLGIIHYAVRLFALDDPVFEQGTISDPHH